MHLPSHSRLDHTNTSLSLSKIRSLITTPACFTVDTTHSSCCATHIENHRAGAEVVTGDAIK
uniref:Uncharacterized protein n=1 Tax=Arundo donax TaxID=35708 RepID=A0A0A8ZN39_ARUDO